MQDIVRPPEDNSISTRTPKACTPGNWCACFWCVCSKSWKPWKDDGTQGHHGHFSIEIVAELVQIICDLARNHWQGTDPLWQQPLYVTVMRWFPSLIARVAQDSCTIDIPQMHQRSPYQLWQQGLPLTGAPCALQHSVTIGAHGLKILRKIRGWGGKQTLCSFEQAAHTDDRTNVMLLFIDQILRNDRMGLQHKYEGSPHLQHLANSEGSPHSPLRTISEELWGNPSEALIHNCTHDIWQTLR